MLHLIFCDKKFQMQRMRLVISYTRWSRFAF